MCRNAPVIFIISSLVSEGDIAASNCTECPKRDYNVAESEKLGYLKRTSDTKSIQLAIANSTYSLVVNGTWVEDVFSTGDDAAQKTIFNLTERHEFFLLHNYTAGDFQKQNIKAMMESGFLGLSPNLGSGKKTFAQYLKSQKLIESDTLSLDYDRDEEKKSKGDNLRASLTFGKFNSSLPSSSIEVVNVD